MSKTLMLTIVPLREKKLSPEINAGDNTADVKSQLLKNSRIHKDPKIAAVVDEIKHFTLVQKQRHEQMNPMNKLI